MSIFVRNGRLMARYKANMHDNIRYQPLTLRLVIIASLSVGQPQNHRILTIFILLTGSTSHEYN